MASALSFVQLVKIGLLIEMCAASAQMGRCVFIHGSTTLTFQIGRISNTVKAVERN